MKTSHVRLRSVHVAPDEGAAVASGWARLLLPALLVFIVALAVRLVGLTQEGAGDELLHVLAARSAVQNGNLTLASGGEPYERTVAFTWLIALLFRVFGESLVVARLPALVVGSLCPVAVWLWLAHLGQRGAAWIAAAVMTFAPMGLILSQQSRFYTLHQLFFFLGCIGVYSLLERRRGVRATLVLGAGAGLALYAANYLQDSTKVGLLGLGLYVLLVMARPAYDWWRSRPRRGPILAGAVAGSVVAVVVGLNLIDLERTLRIAGHADPWAQGSVGAWRFYHWILLDGFPTLWTLFPLLLVLAAAAHWRATLLSSCVFGLGLMVHSLLPWKSERYVEYLMPFFFSIVAMGLARALPLVRSSIEQVIAGWPLAARRPRVRTVLTAGVVLAACGFAIAGNRAFLRTIDLLRRDPTFAHPGMESGSLSWSRAAERLAPVVAQVDAVVGTEDTKTLYYLGRMDYLLDHDHLKQWSDDPEFTVDEVLAVPMLSLPSSVADLVACHRTGLLVAQSWSMRTEWKMPRSTAEYIEANMVRVPLPEEWGIAAYRWESSSPDPARCPPGRSLRRQPAPLEGHELGARPLSGADVTSSRLGRDAVTYGLSFLAGRAASVVMLPVYTRYFRVEDYGVLHLVDLVLTVIVLLLREGITAGAMRFYFKERTEAGQHTVMATTFLLVQTFSVCAAAVVFGAAPLLAESFLPAPEHAFLLRLAAVSLLFEGCFLVPTIYFQITQRSRAFMQVSLARLALTVSLNVVFIVFLGWGIMGPLASGLIANVVLGVPLSVWLIRRVGIRARLDAAKRLLRFGMPFRVAQLGAFVLTFGDRFVLQRTHGADAVGLYGLGYQFGFLLAMLSGVPFLTAWNPQRFALAAEPREVRDKRYNEGLLYLGLVVVAVGVGIALFVRPALEVMSDPAYHPAAAIVPILVLAYAMQVWTDVVELGIQVSERTEYAMVATWASVVVVVALYLTLIPPYGAFGAAWATLLAFVFRFAAFYYFSHRLWPVSYEWRPTILLLLCGSGVVGASMLWSPEGFVPQCVNAGIWFAIFVLMAWFGILPGSVREAFGSTAVRTWRAVAAARRA